MPTRLRTGLSTTPADLERSIAALGGELRAALTGLLDVLPEGGQGPQNLARALGLDKVFTSRLLKAVRSKDPIAVVHQLPGPDPLSRFCRAARRKGAPARLAKKAEAVIEDFRGLIRDVGDRSSLDAMISTWLPQAREEFELRRKQAAFKAMSQLKGVAAETNLATVILHPSADGERVDVVWIVGLLGIQRLRPGARAKLATRRMAQNGSKRHPVTLEGESVEGLEGLRLDEFCHAPPAELEVRHVGETVHYLLGGEGFGRHATCDLLLAEVNLSEIARVPEKGRRGYVFAEVGTPSRTMLFDVHVHRDVYPGIAPELAVYDTSFDGIVDVNDPAREIDRLDLAENLIQLGPGTSQLRTPDVPDYQELLTHVYGRTGWSAAEFRTIRCRAEYPLYGSQYAISFDPSR